jgi:formate dehydrogenase major subunit
MRSLCPKFAGASYEKMEKQGAVPWPCTSEEDPGTDYLYDDGKFMTENGRGKLFACEWRHPFELTDEKYPLVLSTVREIGHYSVRTMTGNCRTLQKLADEPGYIEISVEDAKELNIKDQELVTVSSRRGKIITRAAVAERVKKGATYMTYQWWVGACNELTIDSLDPISKTPEFKYCAVKVERIKDQQKAEQEIEERYSSLKKQMKAE